MAKALYAFEKTVTDKRWRRQFAHFLRRFTTSALSASEIG
jgi:hypothetical protein